MATISKYLDPEGREPAAVLCKPLLGPGGGANGRNAPSLEIDFGDSSASHNAARDGGALFYLPLVDAQKFRVDGLVDF